MHVYGYHYYYWEVLNSIDGECLSTTECAHTNYIIKGNRHTPWYMNTQWHVSTDTKHNTTTETDVHIWARIRDVVYGHTCKHRYTTWYMNTDVSTDTKHGIWKGTIPHMLYSHHRYTYITDNRCTIAILSADKHTWKRTDVHEMEPLDIVPFVTRDTLTYTSEQIYRIISYPRQA